MAGLIAAAARTFLEDHKGRRRSVHASQVSRVQGSAGVEVDGPCSGPDCEDPARAHESAGHNLAIRAPGVSNNTPEWRTPGPQVEIPEPRWSSAGGNLGGDQAARLALGWNGAGSSGANGEQGEATDAPREVGFEI